MTSTCPNPTLDQVSAPDLSAGTAIALKAMGIQACQTTNTAGGAVSIIPPVAAGFDTNSSIGCEQIAAISNAVAVAQNQVTCVLNSVKSSSATNIQQVNSITLNASGGNYNITINQSNTGTVSLYSNLTDQLQTNISDALSNSIDSLITNLQSSKTGFLSTPQGQKTVVSLSETATSNQLKSLSNSTAVTDAAKVLQSNSITINLTGADYFSANNPQNSTLYLTQDNAISYQASMIVSAFYDQVFSSTATADLVAGIKNSQSTEAAGADSLLSSLFSPGIIIMVVIVLLVLGFTMFGGSAINNVLKYIIPITLAGAIVVAVVFGLQKNFLVAGVSGGAAVLLGIFEFMSVGRSTAPRI